MTKVFYARLANRPLLVLDFLALNRERPKVETKNGRLSSLASNPWISVAILGTMS